MGLGVYGLRGLGPWGVLLQDTPKEAGIIEHAGQELWGAERFAKHATRLLLLKTCCVAWQRKLFNVVGYRIKITPVHVFFV